MYPMIQTNQRILPSAGVRKSLRGTPAYALLILALGMIFCWGAGNEAKAQSVNITGTAGNSTPELIIGNELQALNGLTSGTINYQSQFAGATALEIENALIAALNQFPGPN